jgi:hypothetical protein
MLYCQSAPADHRAPASYALTFARTCGHEYHARTLACLEHGAWVRSRPRAEQDTECERCGLPGRLTLIRIEDVFEERIVIPLSRAIVEHSRLSPVTIAYDRAYQAALDNGWDPVTAYRAPVQWRPQVVRHPVGAELTEAHVTVAVTHPQLELTG